MTDKAVISTYTWRSKEMQVANYEGLPHFFLPDDLTALLRVTQRKSCNVFRCMSLAVLAETEKDFRHFVKSAWKLGAIIRSDLGHCLSAGDKMSECVAAWKSARRQGAAKAGGEATADKSEKEFWAKFAIIVDRWHLRTDTNKALLDEADIGSRNTVKYYLGGITREEWQALTDNQRARILKGKAKWPINQ